MKSKNISCHKLYRAVYAAMPLDVRYGSALPQSPLVLPGLRPNGRGIAPEIKGNLAGRSQTFRTSGGTAAIRIPDFFTATNTFVRLILLILLVLLFPAQTTAQKQSSVRVRMERLLGLSPQKTPQIGRAHV